MPGSITPDLLTVSLADAVTGWSGNSGQLDTEVYKQAASIGSDGSYTWAVRKNTFDSVTFTPATNINMTANYTTPHLYWTMRCDVFPFCEALNTSSTNSGLMVRATDGSGNWTQWHVSGSDVWDGGWRTFVLDLTNTTDVHSSSGTLSLADVDIITWYVDNSNSGNIRVIDNTWMDAVRYGDGLQAESAAAEAFGFEDVALDDGLTANYYGVQQEVDGVFFTQGGVVLGDATGSGTCNFVSANETVFFRDQLVSSSHYRIAGVASATATTDIDIDGLVARTVGGSAAEWDFSDADLNSYVMVNSVLIDMGGVSLRVGSTDASSFSGCGAFTIAGSHAVTGATFTLCGKLTIQNTATLDSCNIADSADAIALTCADPSKISNCEFDSDGTGHAIEITATGTWTFTGNKFTGYLTADGSTGNETIYNNSGGAVVLNIAGGGDTDTVISVRNSGGSSTTINSSFTLTLTGLPSGVQVTIVNSNTRTELKNEVSIGADITYGHGGGETVDIMFMANAYDPNVSDIFSLTLPNSDSSIPINLLDDPNYANP